MDFTKGSEKMDIVVGKPLQPLSYGSIVIVGAKNSNFDRDITGNPRVIIWDSQDERWHGKNLPDNTRAVFMTRFISHSQTEMIIKEARKRQITLFNVDGTGIINKQVRELLGMTNQQLVEKIDQVLEQKHIKGKLTPLISFIDFSKTNKENSSVLLAKALEFGITTTESSLAQLVVQQRRKQHGTAVPKSIRAKVDVSVEILDTAIRELTDVRQFLIDTVAENQSLREKLAKFKKLMAEE